MSESDQVDRRRLLKGAAAAGIGVAAWSAPSITALGGTPVYAAACTGGKTSQNIGGRNTSCSCGNNPKHVGYHPPSASACAGTPNPALAFLANGNCGNPVTNSFVCPQGTKANDNAGFCIKPPAGKFCRVKATIELGNCGGSFITSVTSGIVGPGNGTLTFFSQLPKVVCGSSFESSNIFIRYTVECADDDACL